MFWRLAWTDGPPRVEWPRSSPHLSPGGRGVGAAGFDLGQAQVRPGARCGSNESKPALQSLTGPVDLHGAAFSDFQIDSSS